MTGALPPLPVIKWNYTSSTRYAFMAYAGTRLHLFFRVFVSVLILFIYLFISLGVMYLPKASKFHQSLQLTRSCVCSICEVLQRTIDRF